MKDKAHVSLWEGFGLAVSHILASPVSTLFIVVYVSRDAGVPPPAQGNFLALTFIGLGVATTLQALRGRVIGSGFLAVSGVASAYTAVLLPVAQAGGLPLVAGMTVVAGVVEIAIAPMLRYVRYLFPPSVLAVILALIGIYVGELGIELLSGIRTQPIEDLVVRAIAGLSVLLIFGLTVWGTRRLRQMALLIGLAVGFLLLWGFNLIPTDAHENLRTSVWFQWPTLWTRSITFDTAYIAPFAIMAMIVAVRHIGLISTLQRETGVDWKEPDMVNIAKAQFASGLGTILSGILGGGPTGIGSNSVALATQSKVYDRWIGFLAGGLLIVVGLSPNVYSLLLVVPDPLLGTALLTLGASMLVSALRLVDFKQIQPADILIIGTGLILGVHVEIHSDLYRALPEVTRGDIVEDSGASLLVIASSGLTVGVIGAAALNLFFKLGKAVWPSTDD